MNKPQIIQEHAISLVEVKDELAKIKKRDGELNFRANKTEDYLNTIVKISPKKANDLYKALEDLQIPRLKDSHLKKMVDILPKTLKEVKVVLQAYTLTVSNENMQKIADVVAQHV